MKKNFLSLGLFVLAFALIEAAVVVYLRELYYPEGFSFPLKLMPTKIFFIELTRELATLIVLFFAGVLSGRNFSEKIAYSIYSFGAWDIFFYLWLKIFLNWPESFLTWDILFLIPLPWSGPVIAPIVVSLILMFFAFGIIYFSEKEMKPRINRLDYIFLFCAVLLAFISFIWNAPQLLKQQLPAGFPWGIFLISISLSLLSFYRLFIS